MPRPRVDADGVHWCLRKRIGRDLKCEMNHATLQRMRHFVYQFCVKHLEPLKTLMTFEEWLDCSNYSIQKKQAFTRLHDENDYQCVKRAKVKCFLKDEYYNDYKALRLIASRDDASKTYLGPIFKSIEEEVFKLPFFVKGLTEQERVVKLNEMFGERPCYVTDYTSFETHFTKKVMKNCEMVLYNYMLKNFPLERRLLKVIMGKNRLTSKLFTGSIDAVRMSGECNTSLGNGFSNAMFMLFFCKEHHINVGSFVVEGDDGLFELSREISPEEFVPYGLTLKINRTTAPQSSFCGCIYNPDTLTNFGQVFQHCVSFCYVGWRYLRVSDKKLRELQCARAYSYNSTYPGVPLLWALCKKAMEHRIGFGRALTLLAKQNKWMHSLGRKWEFSLEVVPPTQSDRDYFSILTGMSVDEQVALEDNILKCKDGEWDGSKLRGYVPESWFDFGEFNLETLENY